MKKFLCPDQTYCNASECIEKCRMGERCLPRSFLKVVAETRKWEGRPSVTQLLKGTREAYLEITGDQLINPFDSAFMVLGIGSHTNVEQELERQSINVDGVEITGLPDDIEDDTLLVDYKVLGSYKIAKVLGIVEESKGHFAYVESEKDNFEYEMQLNMYRLIAIENGKNINKMKLCMFTRDGNTYMAKKRGLLENIYYINVKFINDEEVLEYFSRKARALVNAVNTQTLPPICNSRECWDGRKCADYCNVKHMCKGNPYL